MRAAPPVPVGPRIAFADVAQHRIRQAELLEALAHLFNLRFYTEEATRTVWIEPEGEFFGAGPEADWSRRTDFSQSVERREIAPEIHEVRTWRYQDGDGAVTRFDAGEESPLGSWSFETGSYAALQGEKTVRNPLFAPSLNSAGHYLNAPSALILRVGDRDDAEEDGTNFTPRIVRYAGMRDILLGRPNIRWRRSTSRETRGSRSVSRTATGRRDCTATTTARCAGKPPANVSPSRCGSRPTSSKRSSRPAREPRRSARSSASTPERAW